MEHSDVTDEVQVVVEQQVLYARRAVLATASSHFQQLLKLADVTSPETPVIHITDVRRKIFQVRRLYVVKRK